MIPDIAYFECLHELKLIVDLIQEGGLAYMRFSVSDTAEYGDYTRGPRVVNPAVRDEMKKILSEIQSGQFAKEWIDENKTGRKNFLRMREEARHQKIEEVGRELRAMMPWLSKKKEAGVPQDDESQVEQVETGGAARRKSGGPLQRRHRKDADTSAYMKITTLDTTLRDGTQGEAISFTVDDKLAIALKLDELGIEYIEGGWPGSNPRDKDFFTRARELHLKHARLTAFGSTRFAKNRVDRDPNVRALVDAGTPVISIFGKTWDLHTKRALNITRRGEHQAHLRDRALSEGQRQGSDLRRRALLRRLHR